MRFVIFFLFVTFSTLTWPDVDLPGPVEQWLKVNNTADTSSRNAMIDQLIAHDYVSLSMNDVVSGNREQLKSYLSGAHKAFSDYRLRVIDSTRQADMVWLRMEASGVHKDELLGVPATNRSIAVGLVVVLQVSEEHVLREWQLSDTGSLLRQISAPVDSDQHVNQSLESKE